MILVKTIFDRIINILPFALLLLTGVSALVSSFEWYVPISHYLGDSIGYSLAVNLWAIKIYWKKHYCIPTKIAVGGLITMNLVSLTTKNTMYYNSQHDLFIISIVILVSVALKWFKW